MQHEPTITFAPYDIVADREFLSMAHSETFKITFKKEITPEWLEAELAKPRDMRDGAYLDGKLVGICDLQRRGSEGGADYGNVNFFFITPELRDNGLGGQLITHAADWCRSQGLKELRLRTGGDNVRAQKSYEKNGFERMPQWDTEGGELGYSKPIAP